MRKLICLVLSILLTLGSFTATVFAETTDSYAFRVGVILNTSNTLLESAVVGDGMGEFPQSAIDEFIRIRDNYYAVVQTGNPAQVEAASLALIEGYTALTDSKNANQTDLDRYNKYITDATNLLLSKTVGIEPGNILQENYDMMMSFLNGLSPYPEGTIVKLGVIRRGDEAISNAINAYMVYLTEEESQALKAETPEVIEEPIVEEPLVEEPVIEEPTTETAETLPITITDLVTDKPANQTQAQVDALNNKVVDLLVEAGKLNMASKNPEEGQKLFEEVIIPVGDLYNDQNQKTTSSKELMKESIDLANITIALSGDVALDGGALQVADGQVTIEPTPESLAAAAQRTENAEKVVEGLIGNYVDEGLEDAVVSAVNIVVPDTMEKLPKVQVNVKKETVQLLNDANVERLNLDMGKVNFGINDKFLDKHEQTDFQFEVDKLTPLKGDDIASGDTGVETVDAPVYDLGANQNAQRGDRFKHPVNLSFDLDAIETDLGANQEFVVYRFYEDKGEWMPVSGYYDPATNTITVSRLHLSKYTLLKADKNFNNIEDSWAKNEIASLKNNGVIKDTELFDPKDELSREEFASWIVAAYGLDSESLENDFKDVDKDDPYYEAITTAYEHGIVAGDGAGNFKGDSNISKRELAMMISSALDNYEDTVDTDTFDLAKYEGDMPKWALDSVEEVVENGLAEESYFGLDDTVTKEEAAAILYKVYR